MSIEVRSSVFEHENAIPQKYACDGDDVSPPIEWRGVPAEAQSVALIANDPDAPGGTFTHWVVFNIPVGESGFEEGVPNTTRLANGAVQGVNDFKKIGYGGPCPPDGIHRYFFQVFALDTELDLSGDVTENELREAMQGHVVAEGEVMGKYRKQ